VLIVNASGTNGVGPALVLGPDLQAALAGLPVEDRDRAEVGVRADPELVRLRRSGVLERRVPVDVHRVGRVTGVPGEEAGLQTQRMRAQSQQLVGE
jgi:hypothetical protein